MAGPSTALVDRSRAALLAGAVRALGATWRVRVEGEASWVEALAGGPVVYAFWHGAQLALAAQHADQGVVGMASRSPDGALLAAVIERLGYGVVRGSSSRGGAAALRGALKALSEGRSVALAVDGPRGPRHRAAPGAAALALRTGRPVVCVGMRARPVWRLRSWDRFEIPLPLARVGVRYAVVKPVGDVEALRAQVERALVGLTGSR